MVDLHPGAVNYGFPVEPESSFSAENPVKLKTEGKPLRYLIFGMESYYPGGGWEDFLGSTEFFGVAKTFIQHSKKDWHEIVDLETGERHVI